MRSLSSTGLQRTLPLAVVSSCIFILAAMVCAQSGRPAALQECRKALYGGDFVRAAELAENHLRKFPNDVPVRVYLGRAELAQGKFQEAFEQLKKALAADPRNVDALYYMSFAARQLSQIEYQRLFSLAPESSRAHQLLAEAALAAQNPTEAEREFQNALKANPRSAEVLTELAELKRSQSKFDEAIRFYKQAEQIGPLNYEIAYGLGACYTYQEEYPEATQWLRKAAGLAPDSAAGRFALGNVLFQSGDLAASIPELTAALKLEPRMKQAYFLLGRAYSKLGRQEEAKAALAKLDELNRSEVPGQPNEPINKVTPKPDTPQQK